MSIVEGGVSVGGLMVPLVVWGIGEYGWRPTVLVMGIVAILVGPLIAWVVGKRPTPEQLATQVMYRQAEGKRRRVRESSHDFTVKEALRTRAFWSISMTHMLVNFSTGGISAHLFLHLSDDNGVGSGRCNGIGGGADIGDDGVRFAAGWRGDWGYVG